MLGSLSAPKSIVRIITGRSAQRTGDCRVGVDLLLLGRFLVAGQEQEFGAIQADAVRSALLALLHFVGKLDVAQQLDPRTVGRLRRQVAQLFELGGQRTVLHDFVPIAGQRLLVRVQNHQPLKAVDDRVFTARDVGQKRPDAHHRGNPQRFGDNRRVAARPADLRDKTADVLRIQIRRFTRREIVGQHQHFGIDVGQLFAPLAEQMPQQPLLDVEDVVRPLRHHAFERLNHLGIMPQRAAHRVLRRIVTLADHLLQLGAQALVVEHLDMGRKDRRVFLAQLLGNLGPLALDLVGRRYDRPVQPFELVFHGVTRQKTTRDAKPLVVHDEHFADRHAGRDGNPLKTFHADSDGLPARSAPVTAASWPACIPPSNQGISRTAVGREQAASIATPIARYPHPPEESCGGNRRAVECRVVER